VSQTAWYAARSAGIIAYLLLTCSVVVGVSMSARLKLAWPRFAVEDLHRFLARLTAVFILIHGGALLADRFLPFSPVQLVVPGASSYRPFAVALGVVAAELLVAVAVTNLLRRRLPHRLWRRAHYLTIAVWLGATGHALLAGSDRHDHWFLVLMAFSAAAVALAFLSRIHGRVTLPAGLTAGGAVVAAMLALAYAPQAQSPHHTRPVVRTAARLLPRAYHAPVHVQITSQPGDPLISIVGSAGSARVRVDLLSSGQEITQAALQMRFHDGAVCIGTVSSLSSTRLTGSCNARSVRIDWRQTASRSLAGTMHVTS
jgi:sulfoxide reductase heme-binding subunit YedZ